MEIYPFALKRMNKTNFSELPQGVWNNEPNRASWIDDQTGLNCAIVRLDRGNLDGYVGIPATHMLYGLEYDQKFDNDKTLDSILECHGGLTYSNIGADNALWWFGFDTCHFRDLTPIFSDFIEGIRVYRDFEYVKENVTCLAHQLKKLERKVLGVKND